MVEVSQNQNDVEYITIPKGGRPSKINCTDYNAIRQSLDNGISTAVLAQQYNVSIRTMQRTARKARLAYARQRQQQQEES